VTLATSRDFKRVGDNDDGANTGGMGAYAPMLESSSNEVGEVERTIIEPTLAELTRRGIDYRGVLYAGLMMTEAGPKLLEYNVRFGDPETEVLVPLYGDELFDLLLSTAEGRLEGTSPRDRGAAVTVVLAAEGYPQSPRKGDVISGLGPDGQLANPTEGVTVFHAGTLRNDAGEFITRSGRVVAVTGVGETIEAARRLAYEGAGQIAFKGSVRRSDIARDARGAA